MSANEGVAYTGVPSADELERCPGIPSYERMKKGRVAVIECVQEIPCNPCENACKFGAINIGEHITELPRIDEDKCTGCGLCVANCPGLAITVINKAYCGGMASIDFPFEYIPLPNEGDVVTAVNRSGEAVCEGVIISVKKLESYCQTAVISMKIPLQYADDVRSIKRIERRNK